MTTVAPLQLFDLARLFIGLLMGMLVLWSGCGFLFFGDIIMPRGLLLRLLFLGLVVAISVGLTWVMYKRFFHAVLCYDENGFELRQGRNYIAGQWGDFSYVSLFHSGGGGFVVRLYKDEDRFEEIPVSALKLDPSEFRFLAMNYIRS
jgi:hypothetical protein